MTILDTLKSLLGLESRDRRPETDEDVGVTVEREIGEEPDASSERSVKGVGESGDDDGSAAETALSEEPQATGVDAGSEGAEPDATDGTVEADEAGGTDSSDDAGETTDTDEPDGTVEIEDAEGGDETDADVGTDESPDVLDGIGPAYAERLADVGIETVADLAAADPSSLAEEADISESRLERWIERARDR